MNTSRVDRISIVGYSELRIHSMVPKDSRQVDNVPEVPTHERGDVRDGGHRNMLGIRQHVGFKDAVG